MAYNESLKAAIEDVQTTIASITGVAAAPLSPPDAPSGQWPLSIAFPRLGSITGGGSQQVVGLHTIICQIHYSRSDLARAYVGIIPYLESVIEAVLADPTLGGTVTTINGELAYTFGGMTFAGIDTIGWEFEIPVKIRYTEA
jgi:hypothetical protein